MQYSGGRPQRSSKLDRPFTNSPVHTLLGGGCFAHYCVLILVRSLPSDHASLEVRFLPPRLGGRFKVPKWALRHPLYAEPLSEAAEAIQLADIPPVDALAEIAHVARATVAEVRHSRVEVGPKAFAWQAF